MADAVSTTVAAGAPRGSSLFARTALVLGLALVTFQSLALWVVYRTVIVPIAERSADDLAGLIVLSAQTWVELPPATRPAFEEELSAQHGLTLRAQPRFATAPAPRFSFSSQIEDALSDRLGEPVTLGGVVGERDAWVEIPFADHRLQVGFLPQRYAVELPLAAVAIIGLGLLLSLVTALFIVRRLAVPLARAASAAAQVGAGETPAPLPETGPRELVELASRFNRMAREVRELLDNRTTLLSGISHDLRTPMTRLRLTLEILRDKPEPARIDRAVADLEAMNALIAGYLELARSTRGEARQPIDLDELLAGLAAGAHEAGQSVHYEGAGRPVIAAVAPLTLRQIIGNLIENAVRYGGGEVSLQLAEDASALRVVVGDQGPGLAEDQLDKVFRPFYRVETSRAAASGGAGLGLAIVRQLAQSQGWSVRLENRLVEGRCVGLDAIVELPGAGNPRRELREGSA
jgi:two-component system osmolarity sensor histidine kinase EnvZ